MQLSISCITDAFSRRKYAIVPVNRIRPLNPLHDYQLMQLITLLIRPTDFPEIPIDFDVRTAWRDRVTRLLIHAGRHAADASHQMLTLGNIRVLSQSPESRLRANRHVGIRANTRASTSHWSKSSIVTFLQREKSLAKKKRKEAAALRNMYRSNVDLH